MADGQPDIKGDTAGKPPVLKPKLKPVGAAAPAPDAPKAAPAAPATAKPPVLKPKLTPVGGAAAPPVLKPAGTAPAGDTPALSSKNETSRIPLVDAKAAAATGDLTDDALTKKISVKPAATDKPVPQRLNDKQKTSRISLEAALDPGEGDGAAPDTKTIRLKPPSEAATVKAKTKLAPPKVVTGASVDKTAQIDDAAIAGGEEAADTQKKTIRVKRPTQRAGVKSVAGKKKSLSVKKGADEAEDEIAPAAMASAEFVEAPDSPNVVFHIFGILGIVTLIVMLVLLLSQAIGPNSSLTQLSYWKDGPNVSLLSKIQKSQ